MSQVFLVILLSIGWLFFETAQAKGDAEKMAENKVLLVAQEFIDKEYPAFDKTGMKAVILEEREGEWVVTFHLPTENTFAGRPAKVATPIIVINKKTFEVHQAYKEQ